MSNISIRTAIRLSICRRWSGAIAVQKAHFEMDRAKDSWTSIKLIWRFWSPIINSRLGSIRRRAAQSSKLVHRYTYLRLSKSISRFIRNKCKREEIMDNDFTRHCSPNLSDSQAKDRKNCFKPTSYQPSTAARNTNTPSLRPNNSEVSRRRHL